VAGALNELLVDLLVESDDLNAIVGGLDAAALATPTPAVGWSVADTMGHLWYFDREGRRALEDPAGFEAGITELLADPEAFMAKHLAEAHRLGESLLSAWHEERQLIIAALRAVDPTTRVPWYGPSMSVMSFATARLMETWAHGQDVADALGVTRQPTDRLRHVADLGVRTREFSYTIKGLTAPDVPVFVSLTSPDGDEWTWGEPEATNRVSGPALDFCLLVTQRRLRADLALTVTGDAAREWMSLAQAFAGGPTLTDENRHSLAS
jgi:uncharacterized protein (TIGR03084 family)